MARGGKELNAMDKWRKQQKQKQTKQKKKERDERLSAIPAHKRDPAPLVAEIYRLAVQEYEGKLNSDGRLRKKHLTDQYYSIKKVRTAAGLETIDLVPFDAESYEAEKKNRLARLRGMTAEGKGREDEKTIKEDDEDDLDERGFPRLPNEEPPVSAFPGLPPYFDEPLEPEDIQEEFDEDEVELDEESHQLIEDSHEYLVEEHESADVTIEGKSLESSKNQDDEYAQFMAEINKL